MSTIPGYTLEDYVMWELDLIVDGDGHANLSLQVAEAMGQQTRRTNITANQFGKIMELFEPYRAKVESALLDYDYEYQSWRDYAGIAFDFIPEDVLTKARNSLRV